MQASSQESGRGYGKLAVCPRCWRDRLCWTDGGYLEQGEYAGSRYDAERSVYGYRCEACGLVLYTPEPLAVALGYRPDPDVERGRRERLARPSGVDR